MRNKYKMITKLKKILSAAGLFLLLLPALHAEVPETAFWNDSQLEENGFEIKAQNDKLVLFYNTEKAIFAVKVRTSGYVWYSSPLNWENDALSSGYNKNALPSLLSIRMKDNKNSLYNANSWVNVVKRKGLRVSGIKDGIEMVHQFKRDGIDVTLDVQLDGDSLVLSVPYNKIWEDPDDVMRLLDFQVAPYFGAAPDSEKGYLFVPDGSGAVINFNNKRSEYTYEQYVYGRDKSVIPVMKKTVEEDVHFPVFGMAREKAGFIAVLEKSAAGGVLSAETAGQKTGYNAISSGCIVRNFDVFTFREKTGTPRDIVIFQSRDFENTDQSFSVRYIFLDDGQNNYIGMADAYRSYLQQKGEFPKTTTAVKPSLMLNFIGAGIKKVPVMGIPQNTIVPYTPFSDVRMVIEKLQQSGVDDFTVKFDGWIKGGVLGKYPSKAVPEKSLGGKKGFSRLTGWLSDQNIDFYGGADFVDLYKSDFGHLKELSANRAINRSPVEIPDYRMSTFDEKPEDAYNYWILRVSKITDFYTKFIKSLDKRYKMLGLAPDSLGNVIGSDFAKKKGASRSETAEKFAELLNKTAEKHSLMLSRPCDYALESASYISDVPVNSSRYDIEDYSIPFYQILLHGYIPFSNLSGNRTLDEYSYILNLVETGSDPSYLWITGNSDLISESRLEYYTGIYYGDWVKEAVEVYKQVQPVLCKVDGIPIKNHQVLQNGSHITEFENGVRVLTNYSDKTVTVDGMTAPSHGFAVSEDK